MEPVYGVDHGGVLIHRDVELLHPPLDDEGVGALIVVVHVATVRRGCHVSKRLEVVGDSMAAAATDAREESSQFKLFYPAFVASGVPP